MFYIIIFSFSLLVLAYIIDRLIYPLGLKRKLFILISIFTFFIGLCFPIYLTIQFNPDNWIIPFGRFSTLMAGFLSFILAYTLIVDLIKFVLYIGRYKLDCKSKRILGAAVIITASISTVFGNYQATNPKVVDVEIPIPFKNPHIKQITIAQLTDLHITRLTTQNWTERIVKETNELAPDIIVVTGDMADLKLPDCENKLSPLNQLSARYGVYGVLGNHEYYGQQVEDWTNYLEELSIHMLNNENTIISHQGEAILLAGTTDNAGEYFNLPTPNPEIAIQSDSVTSFSVLLSHQPVNIEKSKNAGFNVQLSGHTHGGQFFPWNLFVGYAQDYIKGLYTIDNTLLYVNQGTGFWAIPVRLGTFSEITFIRLVNSNFKK